MLFITSIDNDNLFFQYGQSILVSGQQQTGKTWFITKKILSDLMYEYDNTYILSSNYFLEWEKYGKMILEQELEIVNERINTNSDNVIIIIDNYQLKNLSKSNIDLLSRLVNRTPKNLTIIFENNFILEIPIMIRNSFNYTLLAKNFRRDYLKHIRFEKDNLNEIGEMLRNLNDYEFVGIEQYLPIKIKETLA
jgi:hypothetical protein